MESCTTEIHPGLSWCVVRLSIQPERQGRYSGCLRPCRAIHDVEQGRIRDLPVFMHRTVVISPRVRVACPHCGPRMALLRGLGPYVRVTRRLGEPVARLSKVASVPHVAGHYELHWKTVREPDKAYLERELGPGGLEGLEGLEVIGMDEFAIQKGHRCATVSVALTRKRVLWVGRGRGRSAGPADRQRGSRAAADEPRLATARGRRGAARATGRQPPPARRPRAA